MACFVKNGEDAADESGAIAIGVGTALLSPGEACGVVFAESRAPTLFSSGRCRAECGQNRQ